NLWACCPLPTHQEETPSFTVRPSMGLFKCFGCGEGGDAISFLQKMRGISYLEAMQYLANKYQVAWVVAGRNPEEERVYKQKEGLYLLLESVRQYYQAQLVKGGPAQDYLRQRGIPKEIVDRFALGYSLDEWQGCYDFATEKGYELAALIDAGLVIQKEHKIYDRFRGRLMIPILDHMGRSIGFGARSLDKVPTGAKYINSPETLVYKKSDVLYGLYQAKEDIRKRNLCYLVEGYTDLFMMHQMGVRAVVAVAGTALTKTQIGLLKRFTNQAILFFDGDEAGIKAVFRGVDLMLSAGMDIKIVSLPAGDDPASFGAKVTQEAFLAHLAASARDFIAFKLAYFLKEQPHDPQQKTAAVHAIVASIALMPDAIKREVYLDLCCTYTKIPKQVLYDVLKAMLKHAPAPKMRIAPKRQDKPKLYEERAVLSLLLQQGNEVVLEDGTKLADFLFQSLAGVSFSSKVYGQLYHLLQDQWQAENQVAGLLWIQLQPEEIQKSINEIISTPYSLSDQWAIIRPTSKQQKMEKRFKVVQKGILRLKLKQARKVLMGEYQRLGEVTDLEDDRLKMFNAAKATEMAIAKQLGVVALSPFVFS
ncbi:MAG: DNA primase, partial [Cytophagales bacterium]